MEPALKAARKQLFPPTFARWAGWHRLFHRLPFLRVVWVWRGPPTHPQPACHARARERLGRLEDPASQVLRIKGNNHRLGAHSGACPLRRSETRWVAGPPVIYMRQRKKRYYETPPPPRGPQEASAPTGVRLTGAGAHLSACAVRLGRSLTLIPATAVGDGASAQEDPAGDAG